MSLLRIRNLCVSFGSRKNPFRAVDGVSLDLEAGELLGIVGESGSGKSVTMMAVMGLLDESAHITADELLFDGQPLLTMPARQRRRIIGKDMAMIFQDPMTALNPSYTVGFQIMESLRVHERLSGAALKRRALELLELVEIPAPESRLSTYPHQLSGGMSQRVMIAMAVACNPRLLIADEPTTALDVTIQAQIMALLQRLQTERGMAMIMITHDLAVVSEVAQRVAVMYAGQIAEVAPVPDIFTEPAHPYTHALLQSLPERSLGERLHTLPGIVPGLYDRPNGCLLAPRCPRVGERCLSQIPALEALPGQAVHQVRCFDPLFAGDRP
ncbi:ABC transporter ATP-binding protein [Amphibiibacter pelophylacis]|uniref:ABC transporter ATP-binding protein n=1 Tax=Amphibiibacter pelophylacis TaxID=1799477 RepID=A0ACC6P5B0_9BURK